MTISHLISAEKAQGALRGVTWVWLCLAAAATTSSACSTPHGTTAASSTATASGDGATAVTPKRAPASAAAVIPSAAASNQPSELEAIRTGVALKLGSPGAASDRRPLAHQLSALADSVRQRRSASARSFTQVGAERSAPLELRASIAVRPDPARAEQQAQVLIAVQAPGAEPPLEVQTELLALGFRDKPKRAALGFARSLLPSVLLDALPAVPLGTDASWTVTFDRREEGRVVHSVHEYRLVRFVASPSAPWAADGPLAELELTWRDSVPGEPESTTVGTLWHSPRWLYPLAQLRNQAQDGDIRLITELRLEQPSWGDLPKPTQTPP